MSLLRAAINEGRRNGEITSEEHRAMMVAREKGSVSRTRSNIIQIDVDGAEIIGSRSKQDADVASTKASRFQLALIDDALGVFEGGLLPAISLRPYPQERKEPKAERCPPTLMLPL